MSFRILEIRPRVSNIANACGVVTETCLDFLEEQGYKGLNGNSLLTIEIAQLIEKEFKKDKEARDRLHGKTEIRYLRPLNNLQDDKACGSELIFSDGNHRVPLLSLENNLFDHILQDVRHEALPVINSCFTDEQALNLCSKMSSPFTRGICRNYLRYDANIPFYKYQLHFIVNKALALYGGKLLTFIYGLKNIDFKKNSAVEIRTYQKVLPEFPVLTFTSGNETLNIAFFLKQTLNKNSIRTDFRVMHSKSKVPIGFLDVNGYIWTKLSEFRPYLHLFYEYSKHSEIKVFAGVSTSHCAICNKPLTDPVSLRIGMGPTCANNIGAGRYFRQ